MVKTYKSALRALRKLACTNCNHTINRGFAWLLGMTPDDAFAAMDDERGDDGISRDPVHGRWLGVYCGFVLARLADTELGVTPEDMERPAREVRHTKRRLENQLRDLCIRGTVAGGVTLGRAACGEAGAMPVRIVFAAPREGRSPIVAELG